MLDYWRVVRRVKSLDLLEMSPARFLVDYVDPALEEVAKILEGAESVSTGKLPLPAGDGDVQGFVSDGGMIPVRLLLTVDNSKDPEETVIVFDFLLRKT